MLQYFILFQIYVLKKSIATLVRSLTEENPKDSDEDAGPTQGVQIATLSKVRADRYQNCVGLSFWDVLMNNIKHTDFEVDLMK